MSHFSSKYVGSFCLVNQKLLFICLKNATYSMLNIPIFFSRSAIWSSIEQWVGIILCLTSAIYKLCDICPCISSFSFKLCLYVVVQLCNLWTYAIFYKTFFVSIWLNCLFIWQCLHQEIRDPIRLQPISAVITPLFKVTLMPLKTLVNNISCILWKAL